MQTFAISLVVYFIVTAGIVYDIINEPPSIGMSKPFIIPIFLTQALLLMNVEFNDHKLFFRIESTVSIF
jgi:hypothetical protein